MPIPSLPPRFPTASDLGWSALEWMVTSGLDGDGVTFQDPRSANQTAFIDYAAMGLMDPKMPVEYRVMGAGYVAANVLGVGSLLYFVDPLRKRPGQGLDETWFDLNNPTYEWPSNVYAEVSGWVPKKAPSFWDFY